jgi:hypothetical protein
MTGGGSGTVAKTGAGKMILPDGAKFYANTPSAEAGTFEITSGSPPPPGASKAATDGG